MEVGCCCDRATRESLAAAMILEDNNLDEVRDLCDLLGNYFKHKGRL